MKNSQRGFIVPLVIIGVLLIIVCVGYYFAMHKDISVAPTPTATSNNSVIASNNDNVVDCGTAVDITSDGESSVKGADPTTIKAWTCFSNALLSCSQAKMISNNSPIEILGKDTTNNLCIIKGPVIIGTSGDQTSYPSAVCKFPTSFIKAEYAYKAKFPIQTWAIALDFALNIHSGPFTDGVPDEQAIDPYSVDCSKS